MAPQYYYRRWDVYLRGERIGEVLAATEQAACLRAIHKFRIEKKDQSELEVRRPEAAMTVELTMAEAVQVKLALVTALLKEGIVRQEDRPPRGQEPDVDEMVDALEVIVAAIALAR